MTSDGSTINAASMNAASMNAAGQSHPAAASAGHAGNKHFLPAGTTTAPPPLHDSSELSELSSDDFKATTFVAKRDAALFCFRCHRPERHAIINRNQWYYSILVGFTFGLILLIGPFRCRCCGGMRWLRSDWMHPKRWFK
jgi:hypothetical protein